MKLNLLAAQLQLDQAATLVAKFGSRAGKWRRVIGSLQDNEQRAFPGLIKHCKRPERSARCIGLPVERPHLGNAVQAPSFLTCAAQQWRICRRCNTDSASECCFRSLDARSGDFDAAERACQQLTPSPPVSRDASVNALAQAKDALHAHHYDAAEAALLRWLAFHPGDLSARFELVVVRRQISMGQIARLLAVAPDSYHVHQLLGQLYVDRGEDDKALTEYLAVAAARPDLPDVHFWLGHLYWKHGDADHAFVELTRQLELDPGHPEANGELGAVLVAENRIDEAIPHLELAIRSKPDLWPAYSQLGRAYAAQKNYARAEEMLRRELPHDHDGTTHYQLGQVLHSEGKNAEANQMFAQVRTLKNEASALPSAMPTQTR